jgi:5-methylcytosine-specific restriction endonuclease McrA
MNQRENYRVVLLEPAKSRIEKNQCAGCGKPKEEWARSKRWNCCSTKCTSEYTKNFLYLSWQDLRMKALRRDDFTCKICGLRPTKEKFKFEYDQNYNPIQIKQWHHGLKDSDLYKGHFETVVDDSKLVGDHIMPIAIGGDEWDINNVQTLCVKCNKVKTRKDMKNIAIARRKENLDKIGQKVLQ